MEEKSSPGGSPGGERQAVGQVHSIGYYTPLREAWGDFVAGFAVWTAFHTLTFSEADRIRPVSQAEALAKWRSYVQILNRDVFGGHYTRYVGHSYFAYCLAIERGARGQLHMHALTDRRTHWSLANKIWRNMAGIVKIVPVVDVPGVARYVSKYVVKEGDIILYRPAVAVSPKKALYWWA